MLHAKARKTRGRAARRAEDGVDDSLAGEHSWHARGASEFGRRLQPGRERPLDIREGGKARPGRGETATGLVPHRRLAGGDWSGRQHVSGRA